MARFNANCGGSRKARKGRRSMIPVPETFGGNTNAFVGN